MAIPSWLSGHINELNLTQIEKAVGRAEAKTAGEIVPMIVGSSSFASHVPLTIALLVFSGLSLFLPALSPRFEVSSVSWDFAILVLSLLSGFLLVRVDFIRRALVPWPDRHRAVDQRAHLEFYATGIPATEGHTGVLIFVSLFERRAVILGDEAISARLKPDVWVTIVDEMLAKFRADHFTDGLTGAIEKVGEILAREFPVQSHDKNELPNSLIIKD